MCQGKRVIRGRGVVVVRGEVVCGAHSDFNGQFMRESLHDGLPSPQDGGWWFLPSPTSPEWWVVVPPFPSMAIHRQVEVHEV